jgi:hypothetical protein
MRVEMRGLTDQAASAVAAAANAVLAAGTAGSVWAAEAHRVRAAFLAPRG